MKRILCALLTLLLILPIFAAASAEVDLSGMSYEELKALKSQVTEAIRVKEIELGLRPDDYLEEFTNLGERFENDILGAAFCGAFAAPRNETGKRVVCVILSITNYSSEVITIDSGTGIFNSFTVYVDDSKVETDANLTKSYEKAFEASLSGELHPEKKQAA